MQRLKELRIEYGLTQRELAEKLSLTQTTIGKYERGELEPSIEVLKKLSNTLECSIDYLIGHSDDFGNITIQTGSKAPAEQLSADERRLLEVFRKLNTKNRLHVATYAEVRLEDQNDDERLRG